MGDVRSDDRAHRVGMDTTQHHTLTDTATVALEGGARYDDLVARHRARMMERMGDHLERVRWDRAALEAHQEDLLRQLLASAIADSPFHQRRLAGIDPAIFRLADLAELPVMTKEEMMAEFDDVVTDRRVTRATVEAHLAAMGTRPDYLFDEYFALTSGGSSGVRGVFVYGWDAGTDFMWAAIRNGLATPTPLRADRRPGPTRMTMLAAGKGYHATRAISGTFAAAVNDLQPLAATMPIDEIVEALNEFQPDQMNGYPSRVASLIAEQRVGRLAIAPVRVVFWAEPFDDDLVRAVHEVWGSVVLNGFGSSEGLLGMSDPDGATIRLAEDLTIIELVDADYRPVAPGTPSACVLVTNLFNPLQPLIRYRIDDVMVEHAVDDPSGYRHVTVTGRNDDPFRYGDVVVHPLSFASALGAVATVTEYQVRQTADGADISLVVWGPTDLVSLAATLETTLAQQGLVAPVVRLEVVDRLDRHAATGKVRRFVPLKPV